MLNAQCSYNNDARRVVTIRAQHSQTVRSELTADTGVRVPGAHRPHNIIRQRNNPTRRKKVSNFTKKMTAVNKTQVVSPRDLPIRNVCIKFVPFFWGICVVFLHNTLTEGI